MSDAHPEVRRVLRLIYSGVTLAPASDLADCSEEAGGHEGSGPRDGGQPSTHTASPSISRGTMTLSIRPPHSAFRLNAVSVSSALYGLQSMGSECGEVQQILELIASCLIRDPIPLSGRVIANALYGLQGCTTEPLPVRRLLRGLSQGMRLAAQSYPLHPGVDYTSGHMSMALYGLQRFTGSGGEKEVELLEGLADNISRSPHMLQERDTAQALYGLQVGQGAEDPL